jgi:NADPH-dependent curcumin reductase CurA
MNKVFLLDRRPIGKPSLTDFKLIEEGMPEAEEGELLLKSLYVSVDPYLRGRMNDAKSYVPPFQLDTPIQSAIIAEVVTSDNPAFKKGDFVLGNLDWKQYQTCLPEGLRKIEADVNHLTPYLGILGMTGLTAYLGLTLVGKPKNDETIVVSGAAGAVGSIVGQIGKLMGCRMVGITGTHEKVSLLQSKFKFDKAIDYNTTPNLQEAIHLACHKGVDVYFDNVGGNISDAVLANINKHARIVLCGAISLYNETKPSLGPRIQPTILTKSATMQGFIISDFADKFPEATKQLALWLQEKKLTYSETIVDGFDNIPEAFINLFTGKNEGKMIVKV